MDSKEFIESLESVRGLSTERLADFTQSVSTSLSIAGVEASKDLLSIYATSWHTLEIPEVVRSRYVEEALIALEGGETPFEVFANMNIGNIRRAICEFIVDGLIEDEKAPISRRESLTILLIEDRSKLTVELALRTLKGLWNRALQMQEKGLSTRPVASWRPGRSL